jgi:cold shock CspA family protein
MKEVGKGRGQVIKWFAEKKFGFTTIEMVAHGDEWSRDDQIVRGRNDAFIHHRDVVMEGVRKLIPGQVVEFDIYRGPKGFTAMNVKVVGDAFDEEGEISGNH